MWKRWGSALVGVLVIGCDDNDPAGYYIDAQMTDASAADAAPADAAAADTGAGGGADMGGAGGQGGMGGAGGQGGAGGEGGMGGAGGAPMPVDCQATCFPAARCATQAEPEDFCPGTWFVETRTLITLCVTRCEADMEAGRRIAAAAACGDKIEILKEDPAFEGLCENGTPLPPAVPECTANGARIAACLVESCADADPIETGIGKLLALGCAGGVAQGFLTREQAGAITAETPCDDAAIAQVVTGLRAMGDARLFIPPLEVLCTEGPRVNPADCDGLCAQAARCSPPAGPLADGDICQAACLPLAGEEGEAQTICGAAADTCNAFAICYTGG